MELQDPITGLKYLIVNFSLNEIINPYFDDCLFRSWEELCEHEPQAASGLISSLQVADAVREYLKLALRINSSYRSHDRKERSPHRLGAIDIVPVHFVSCWKIKAIEFIRKQFPKATTFDEWSGHAEGWLHLEGEKVGLKRRANNWIGYPKAGKMIYEPFAGVYSWQK